MSSVPQEDEYPNQLLGLDSLNDTNQGAVNNLASPLKLQVGSGGGVILTSGPGVPTIGGNLNDLWIRSDASGETAYFYRCTTAGVAGAAVWTAMSGA